ncbi:MAG TPA: TonB-dependent receptor [Steroidobacteraceae bacterium]|nr:TonB-dependent receptor [Steroidobacteraceae bacterium]
MSVTAAVSSAAMLFWSTAMFAAQSQTAAAEKEDEELEEVQVTGTRILSPNATSTNPITSISAEEMRRLGIVNVADALTVLVPQNISTYTPSLTGSTQTDGQQGGGMERTDRGSMFIGNTIANLRGMDPAFGSRTLTLVDGRRTVSTSNQADVIDLNIIPSNLVERLDVVTGGASATYGSGAMAGVVNVVLNRRLDGIRLDMDYGASQRGDGDNPHIALSAGKSGILGGKGHITGSFEWRDQSPIRDCADARAWCQKSTMLFSNNNGGSQALTDPVTPHLGFEGMPRRFAISNARYSQFAPTGTIFVNNVATTTNFRFADAIDPVTGRLGGEDYALGYRGGARGVFDNAYVPNIMNGDGPLMTTGTTLRPSQDSKQFFANFDYDFTETTTLSLQATYGMTNALNKNRYTGGAYCARFDSPVAPSRGTNAQAGTAVTFGFSQTGVTIRRADTNGTYGPFRGSQWRAAPTGVTLPAGVIGATFGAFLGLPTNGDISIGTTWGAGGLGGTGGNGYENAAQLATPPDAAGNRQGATRRRAVAFPFFMPTALSPSPPQFNFNGNAVGTWVRVRFDNWDPTNTALADIYTTEFPNDFWVLDTVQLTTAFDAGTATVLPTLGRNAYAFLNTLSTEALYQVQNAFSNSSGTGGNAFGAAASGIGSLYGSQPCAGSTAISKVWNPQLQQTSSDSSDRLTAQIGLKGRFGSDWRWDTNYSFGQTKSEQNFRNQSTVLRSAFAMDAVIDDRVTRTVDGQTVSNMPGVVGPDGRAGTYGTPICRITRDGAPVLDINGRPLSGADGLARLAAGCQPLNIFGNVYSDSAYVFDRDGNRYFADDGAAITYDAAAMQQAALDYAFVDTRSSGTVTQHSAQLTTSGTLWEGWAGPLTGAFSLDLLQNVNDSRGTEGDIYVKSDLGSNWANAFGGKTRNIEPSIELNMPLLSGVEGAELLAISGTYRHGFYYVKGGAGTTGEHATQETPTWRLSAEYAPFDWVRFRATRSADMRAAGYRELFFYSPLEPDQFEITNPWRPRTATSNENQRERYGQIQVGNPDLKPERSRTLTVGFVLSPGGWAQGMRITADYSDIRVKDGITLPFNANMPVDVCFVQSGGEQPIFDADGNLMNPGAQDAFDPNNRWCQLLRFAEQTDGNGNPIPGTRDLQDLVSYTSASYANGLPYQTRAIDVSLSYNFPLSKAFESAPGSVALNIRGTRALEASGIENLSQLFGVLLNTDPCGRKLELADPQNYNTDGSPRLDGQGRQTVINQYRCIDLVGQLASSSFIPGVAATPNWRGNISASYLYGDLTTTLSANYTGGGVINKDYIDDPNDPGYYTEDGRPTNATIDNNGAKPYVNLSLNASYNLDVANMRQFQVFGSISNLMDKTPPYIGAGGVMGTSPYADTFGRSYRLGVRLQF